MNYAKRHYTSHETTPRQRRLQAQRRFLLARFHERIGMILGGIAFAVIILALFFA